MDSKYRDDPTYYVHQRLLSNANGALKYLFCFFLHITFGVFLSELGVSLDKILFLIIHVCKNQIRTPCPSFTPALVSRMSCT